MPRQTCSVGPCDNKSWLVDRLVKRSHVQELKFHHFPKNEEQRKLWASQVSKGHKDFKIMSGSTICSNHFVKGKPTYDFPYPTLFLTPSDVGLKHSPTKRQLSVKRSNEPFKKDDSIVSKKKATDVGAAIVAEAPVPSTSFEEEKPRDAVFCPSFSFAQLTRERDVQFYTGFENTELFKLVFYQLSPTAIRMQYWKGDKGTKQSACDEGDEDFEEHIKLSGLNRKRRGPARKLTLEQELFLVMVRLRIGALVEDLAFRFQISVSLVTSIFFTWVRLMSHEFQGLIVWSSRENVRKHLPDSFRKYYPKCRVIIDCTELFNETPSSSELAAMCWSQYKHHYMLKFFVGITPNGAISFLLKCYGGRATDIFITEDCGIAKKLIPGNQVMADRGFKIRDLLAYHQCTLTIPPSTVSSSPISESDVKKTSLIANLRIFLEKAIRRVKEYRILSQEMSMLLLPLADDIVTICSAFTNLKRPLLEQ